MTKEQLRAYRDIKLELNILKDTIKNLEATLYGPRSQQLDGMPRSGSSKKGGPFEDLAAKRLEAIQLYYEKAESLEADLLKIEEAIEVLGPKERTLIRLYYLDGLTWEQVCVKMSYSWRQIHRIHGKALEILKTT